MTIETFLSEGMARLKAAGIESARLDCLLFLEDTLKMPRASILAHLDREIDPAPLLHLHTKITQRTMGVPVAYIRGHAAFYGREFIVNEHVLVPRPEAEAMVEMLKALPLPRQPRIVDVGTGSGCIGITAALEIPQSRVTLIDIDAKALAVAKDNAKKHAAKNVHVEHADLLEKQTPCDVVLANLPYIPDNYPINKSAEHEPALAIFAGSDGLKLYRQLFRHIEGLRPLYVLTEALEHQHKALAGIAASAGYKLTKTSGLEQLFSL